MVPMISTSRIGSSRRTLHQTAWHAADHHGTIAMTPTQTPRGGNPCEQPHALRPGATHTRWRTCARARGVLRAIIALESSIQILRHNAEPKQRPRHANRLVDRNADRQAEPLNGSMIE